MSTDSPWEWRAPNLIQRLSRFSKPGYALTGCSLAVCGSFPVIYGLGLFGTVSTAIGSGLLGEVVGIGIFGVLHLLHWVTMPVILVFLMRNYARHGNFTPLALGAISIPMTFLHDLPIVPDSLFNQSVAVLFGNLVFDVAALLLYAGSAVLGIAVILDARAKSSLVIRNPFSR